MSIQDRVKHVFVLMLETVLTARSGDGPYITWRSGPAARSVARSRHNPDYAARVRSSSARPGSFPSAFHDIPLPRNGANNLARNDPTATASDRSDMARYNAPSPLGRRRSRPSTRVSPSSWASAGACSPKVDTVTKAPALPTSASGISVPASPRISSTPTSHELQRLH